MLQGTVANTLGAGFLGLVGACILFGVTVVQNWIYYCNFPNDWAFQKISVAILLVLDTIHLAVTIHAMYHYIVNNFGNVVGLQSLVWSFKLQTTLNVVIVFMVQCLYTLRVWKLGKYRSGGFIIRSIPPIITCVVIAGGVFGFILSVKTYRLAQFEDIRDPSTKWAVAASFASSTVIDMVLAASICYYLYSSRTPFTSTNNRLVVVMHYVLISGALTATCSLSALITFLIMPNNMIFLGISFLLTKLYINSYIAMLNARSSGKDHESSSINIGKLMNLKRRPKTNTDSPSSQTPPDGSLALSSFRARVDDDDTDSDLKHGKADLTTSFGGVTIHRIEERKYDDDIKDWTRV